MAIKLNMLDQDPRQYGNDRASQARVYAETIICQPCYRTHEVAAQGQPATVVMRTLSPVTLLTVGSRDSKNPQGWGAFFDNTPHRPYETFLVALGKRRVQTTTERAPRSVSRKQWEAAFAATSGSRFIAIVPSFTSRPW